MSHSDRAKSGTKKQVEGIIKFLSNSLESYQKEYAKYEKLGLAMAKDALSVISKNIESTKKSLAYYNDLKEKYKKDGLI